MFQFVLPSLFLQFKYEDPAFEPFLRLPLPYQSHYLYLPLILVGANPLCCQEQHSPLKQGSIGGEEVPVRVTKPAPAAQARRPGIRANPEVAATQILACRICSLSTAI